MVVLDAAPMDRRAGTASRGAWSSVVERDVMTIPSASVAVRILNELHDEFADSLPESVIRACARDAIGDLSGSISKEALPEMVTRLARVRLAALIGSAQAGRTA